MFQPLEPKQDFGGAISLPISAPSTPWLLVYDSEPLEKDTAILGWPKAAGKCPLASRCTIALRATLSGANHHSGWCNV